MSSERQQGTQVWLTGFEEAVLVGWLDTECRLGTKFLVFNKADYEDDSVERRSFPVLVKSKRFERWRMLRESELFDIPMNAVATEREPPSGKHIIEFKWSAVSVSLDEHEWLFDLESFRPADTPVDPDLLARQSWGYSGSTFSMPGSMMVDVSITASSIATSTIASDEYFEPEAIDDAMKRMSAATESALLWPPRLLDSNINSESANSSVLTVETLREKMAEWTRDSVRYDPGLRITIEDRS